MKKVKIILIVAVMSLLASSVHAEGSYLGLGVGLHFDLGSLSGTIAKDGLDSSVGKPSMSGASNGTGCNAAVIAGTATAVSCLGEQKGTEQSLIIAENTLIGLEKATNQAYRAKTSGPMVGLVLDLFWESEGANTF